GRAQVPEPALVVPFLDEAVAAEQLDTVRADLGAMGRSEAAGLGDDLARVLTGVESGCGLPHGEAERIELDGDVGDGERHGLAVADRLTEGVPLLYIRDDLVQDRLSGSDGAGRPGEPGAAHDVAV